MKVEYIKLESYCPIQGTPKDYDVVTVIPEEGFFEDFTRDEWEALVQHVKQNF